jgi:hypothetical protein
MAGQVTGGVKLKVKGKVAKFKVKPCGRYATLTSLAAVACLAHRPQALASPV